MEFNINLLIILCSTIFHTISGNFGDDIIEIQPMNPKVREGDNIILTCFSPIPGALVSWLQVSQTSTVFESVERYSFPGGKVIRLGNASRFPTEESSSVAFLCSGNVNGVEEQQLSTVTVVARDFSMAVTEQSSLVIFPLIPVARNGTNFTLTCLAPSENTSDIGWYIPGEQSAKFETFEIRKFDNGANITLIGINVDSTETVIRIVCLQTDETFISEQVDIRVTETIPTTELPISSKSGKERSTIITNPPILVTTPYVTASYVGGIPLSLVLIAIGIGAGLAVFVICLILLSVYVLVVFRSQGWGPFKSSEDVDDVFKANPREIDNYRPYQSLGDKDDASNPRGVGNKEGYADLRQYEEPRLYMRLESKSSSKPQKQEYNVPEAIYDGGDTTAVQMISFRHTDSKEGDV
ncbi:hypothetical protein HOLleu_38588 [Holothuria leucospilota]|uniref:Ig-like domain-containing protein n=1 Tax=Holothuria leucospilota TaxID=206669 RepID=A0A9Q0YIW8_HOLLE|nr:hypothetical protein HOLleu_38588 [Holothuria leucospilota]